MKLSIFFAVASLAPSSSTGGLYRHFPLVPHRHQETRRELTSSAIRRRDVALQVGALYQGYGTHYIDLWVGSPVPQRQTLIVDTGSGVTAFPCSGCTDCGKGYHIDTNYDETKSKTFQKVACGECKRGHCSSPNDANGSCSIGMSYQEGSSWSAFEASDIAYIGGPHDHPLDHDNGGDQDIDPDHAFAFSFRMTFGCQTRLTGLFKTQLADGIMGMDDAPTAFWAQMHDAKIMNNKQFALCFTRQPTADREGTEAGAMTMGGYDERLHTTPLVFTSRGKSGGGFYNVHVRRVYLRHGSGGEGSKSKDPNAKLMALNVPETELNRGNVIVDSGTTDTYFTRRIATEFNSVFQALAGRPYNHNGVDLTEKELLSYPTILIQLEGDKDMNQKLYPDPKSTPGLAVDVDPENPYDVLLAIPPSHYMEYDDKQRKYINRFYADEGSGSVLGANAMMGHDVFFNVDDQKIGWAESDCDYYSLIENNGFIDTLGGGGKTSHATDKKSPDSGSPNSHDSTKPGSGDTITSNVHPAVKACNDTTCRGTVMIVLVSVLAVGVLVGRGCRRDRNKVPYQRPSEMEIPTVENGDFPSVRYRDEPAPDDGGDLDFAKGSYKDEPPAAPSGVGYQDEPSAPKIQVV